MAWTALLVGEDLATGACGVVNAGYFAGYWWRRNGSRGRRIGALALVLVSVAVVVEAAFSQGLYWSAEGATLAAPSIGVWVLVRAPLLLATALITAIIARRVLS